MTGQRAGLRVATWNIFGGRTRDGDRVDLDLTLAALRAIDADVAALQEVDRDQPRSGGVDQARVLAGALGMDWRFAPTLHGTPGDPQGWRRAEPGRPDPGGSAYGIALLSRLPLDGVETVPLPPAGHEPRVALVAGVDAGGRTLTVAGTHLSFVPRPNLRQLRALQRHLAGRAAPRLLLGDLNLWLPLVLAASRPGWWPLVRAATFPNRPGRRLRPRVQLDHVLAHGARGLRAGRHRVLGGPASDHRAVLVELSWG